MKKYKIIYYEYIFVEYLLYFCRVFVEYLSFQNNIGHDNKFYTYIENNVPSRKFIPCVKL